jgi:hypothetical protein
MQRASAAACSSLVAQHELNLWGVRRLLAQIVGKTNKVRSSELPFPQINRDNNI